MKVGQFTNKVANMEIIKYNIEKLGGIESTLSRMEPSLNNFEMRNIEKNLENVNHTSVHPKYFDSSKGFSSGFGLGSQGPSRPKPTGMFPYGGTSGPVDPKESGQYQRDYNMNPDLSNYPCTSI